MQISFAQSNQQLFGQSYFTAGPLTGKVTNNSSWQNAQISSMNGVPGFAVPPAAQILQQNQRQSAQRDQQMPFMNFKMQDRFSSNKLMMSVNEQSNQTLKNSAAAFTFEKTGNNASIPQNILQSVSGSKSVKIPVQQVPLQGSLGQNLVGDLANKYVFKNKFKLADQFDRVPKRASVFMKAPATLDFEVTNMDTDSNDSNKTRKENNQVGESDIPAMANFMDLQFGKGQPQKMGKANDLKDMAEFPGIFTTGGDQAMPLDPVKGHNKFFIKPFVERDSLVRSSCTCAPPTKLGYDAAKYHYEQLKAGEFNVEEIMDGIRSELMRLYELPKGTGIILTPSRYDAQYIPILIARALNHDKEKLVNIIAAKGELGDCTMLAAGGRYFCDTVPFEGYIKPKPEVPIAGLSLNVDVKGLEMRATNGQVINHDEDIEEILKQCHKDDSVPILHSIYGSGTGVIKSYVNMKQVESSKDFTSQIEALGGIHVANANQGRLEKDWLTELLNQDVVVISSGSRFYRGPAHSGAVIIPPSIMNKLQNVDAQEIRKEWGGELVPTALNGFFGKQNFPKELASWRAAVEDNQNPGLALRWVAALAEMEPTLAIPKEAWWSGKMAWRSTVWNHIADYPILQFLEDRADTESIIAVTVLNRETNSTMTVEELEVVYEAMTMDLSDQFDWNQIHSSQATTDKEIQLTINKLYDQSHWESILKYNCYIGRPIKFSENEGLLRISLDSESFRQVVDIMDQDEYLDCIDDEIIVKKMAFLAHNFTQLKKILEKGGQNKQITTGPVQDELKTKEVGTLKNEISELQDEITLKENEIQQRLEILKDQGKNLDSILIPSQLKGPSMNEK